MCPGLPHPRNPHPEAPDRGRGGGLDRDRQAGACCKSTRASRADERTAWHLLRELLAFEIANGGQVSIINRLDRETSGLVLVAKNRAAARHFSMLMERGGIGKEYLAIVWGWPVEDRFEVDAPLLRQGLHGPSRIYLKQCVHPAGRGSPHAFRGGAALCAGDEQRRAVRAGAGLPETGRMHQIRVHLAHAGHPVVGDKIYGPSEEHYLDVHRDGLDASPWSVHCCCAATPCIPPCCARAAMNCAGPPPCPGIWPRFLAAGFRPCAGRRLRRGSS